MSELPVTMDKDYVYGLSHEIDRRVLKKRALIYGGRLERGPTTNVVLYGDEEQQLAMRWRRLTSIEAVRLNNVFTDMKFSINKELEELLVMALLYTSDESFEEAVANAKPSEVGLPDYVTLWRLIGGYYERAAFNKKEGRNVLTPCSLKWVGQFKDLVINTFDDYEKVSDWMETQSLLALREISLEKSKLSHMEDGFDISYDDKAGEVLGTKFMTITPRYAVVDKHLECYGVTYTKPDPLDDSDDNWVVQSDRRGVFEVSDHPLTEEMEKDTKLVFASTGAWSGVRAGVKQPGGWAEHEVDTTFSQHRMPMMQATPNRDSIIEIGMINNGSDVFKMVKSCAVDGLGILGRDITMSKFAGKTHDEFEDYQITEKYNAGSVEEKIGLRVPKFDMKMLGKAYFMKSDIPNSANYTKEILDEGHYWATVPLEEMIRRLPRYTYKGKTGSLGMSDFMIMDDKYFDHRVLALVHSKDKWYRGFYEELTLAVFGVTYSRYYVLPSVRLQLLSFVFCGYALPIWKIVLSQEYCKQQGLPSMFCTAMSENGNFLFKIKRSQLTQFDDYFKFLSHRYRLNGLEMKSSWEDWPLVELDGFRSMFCFLTKQRPDGTIIKGSLADKQHISMTTDYNRSLFLNYEYTMEAPKRAVDVMKGVDKSVNVRYGTRAVSPMDHIQSTQRSDMMCGVTPEANTFCFAPLSDGTMTVLTDRTRDMVVPYEWYKYTERGCNAAISWLRRRQIAESERLIGDVVYKSVPVGLVVNRSDTGYAVRGNGVEIALINDINGAKRERVNAKARATTAAKNQAHAKNGHMVVPIGLSVTYAVREYDNRGDNFEEVFVTVVGDGKVTAPYVETQQYIAQANKVKLARKREFNATLKPYVDMAKSIIVQTPARITEQDMRAATLFKETGQRTIRRAEDVVPATQIRKERQMSGVRPDDPLTPDTNRMHMQDMKTVNTRLYESHIMEDQVADVSIALNSPQFALRHRVRDHETMLYQKEKHEETVLKKILEERRSKLYGAGNAFSIDGGKTILKKPSDIRPMQAFISEKAKATTINDVFLATNWVGGKDINSPETITKFYWAGSNVEYEPITTRRSDTRDDIRKQFDYYEDDSIVPMRDEKVRKLKAETNYIPYKSNDDATKVMPMADEIMKAVVGGCYSDPAKETPTPRSPPPIIPMSVSELQAKVEVMISEGKSDKEIDGVHKQIARAVAKDQKKEAVEKVRLDRLAAKEVKEAKLRELAELEDATTDPVPIPHPEGGYEDRDYDYELSLVFSPKGSESWTIEQQDAFYLDDKLQGELKVKQRTLMRLKEEDEEYVKNCSRDFEAEIDAVLNPPNSDDWDDDMWDDWENEGPQRKKANRVVDMLEELQERMKVIKSRRDADVVELMKMRQVSERVKFGPVTKPLGYTKPTSSLLDNCIFIEAKVTTNGNTKTRYDVYKNLVTGRVVKNMRDTLLVCDTPIHGGDDDKWWRKPDLKDNQTTGEMIKKVTAQVKAKRDCIELDIMRDELMAEREAKRPKLNIGPLGPEVEAAMARGREVARLLRIKYDEEDRKKEEDMKAALGSR